MSIANLSAHERFIQLEDALEEIERLTTALVRYREAQRWATGTEQHRLALEKADAENPIPPAYQQLTSEPK